jgi:uncharacterized protein YmfQ (DUF2313 family)
MLKMDTETARRRIAPIDKRINVELAKSVDRYTELAKQAEYKVTIEEVCTLLSVDADAIKEVKKLYATLLFELVSVVEAEEARG